VEIEFEKLIQLQQLDSEIRQINLFLETTGPLLEDIDKKIAESGQVATSAKDRMVQSQKKRRELEAQVKDLKAQIGKYKRQLNEVKTNKEYTALLKEIEESQAQVDKLEEEFIAEMLVEDDVQKEIKSANQKFAEAQEKFSREKESIFRKKKEKEEQARVLAQQKEGLLPKIPQDQAGLYLRIFRKKAGIALSPVTDDFCSMCHMRVRPQVLNELNEGKKLILCENCGRILYWKEKKADAEAEKEASSKTD
jgi:predicted  nucleic acid-binding Zn-ribbon protein